MPGVADVLRRYGREYLDRFEQDLLPSHRRTIADLLACRTEALGGQLLQCDHCGQEHYVYHSCGHRSCPKCHRLDTEAWLEERRRELLPVPYFHVVFTLPQKLWEIVRRNQKALYDILLRAAAQSLLKLAADPHDVGGLIGVLCVLHTWTRALAYHPHVHCLVPAGGLSADRTQWRPARQTYLVPVRALSKLFRGLFRALVHQERPDLAIPDSEWTTEWVVYCKPALQGTDQVLRYLGRYVQRIALTNSRILSLDDGQVCFRYQGSQDHRWRTMTLPALEFIRRFLQHVLPEGFHKVRYYGLWSPVHRSLLHQLQLCLAHPEPHPSPEFLEPATRPDDTWCVPLAWPDVSALWPRHAGLDPLPTPPRQETAMRAPTAAWTSPVIVITATCLASCGSRPPVRPPLGTCPKTFPSSPPLWPWYRPIHQASTPSQPPNDQGLSCETLTNLLVKRSRLY